MISNGTGQNLTSFDFFRGSLHLVIRDVIYFRNFPHVQVKSTALIYDLIVESGRVQMQRLPGAQA